MRHKKGRSLFSLNYVFASFFGAAMVAGAFFYYNYEFSRYKFFDFNKTVFYQKESLFHPDREKYIVLIYSSNKTNATKLAKNFKNEKKILAIDLYQKRFNQEDSIIHITAGMNTLLQVVQKFNIYSVPSVFSIIKFKDGVYKQDSKITILK
ncbi:MAG TPA: hypothetical protein EYG69_00970 [Campylobacterales bacterium]|nr:hypothetical protein [Campylobacterales bacterium]